MLDTANTFACHPQENFHEEFRLINLVKTITLMYELSFSNKNSKGNNIANKIWFALSELPDSKEEQKKERQMTFYIRAIRDWSEWKRTEQRVTASCLHMWIFCLHLLVVAASCVESKNAHKYKHYVENKSTQMDGRSWKKRLAVCYVSGKPRSSQLIQIIVFGSLTPAWAVLSVVARRVVPYYIFKLLRIHFPFNFYLIKARIKAFSFVFSAFHQILRSNRAFC